MKKENHLLNIRITTLFYLFRLFPVKQNKIVFCNYVGKGYGCNPKYIAEEILKRKKEWDLVWLTDFPEETFPEEIRAVKYESVKAIYELATAKVWVDNQRKLPRYKKRTSQYFIETWHGGGGPMKKIGADNPRNFNNKPYEKTSKHMDRIADLMISNSTCCTRIYRSAFHFTGEILECGYPRNDILVNEHSHLREKVYHYFKLPLSYKTVLYAPTYRNGRGLEAYQLEISNLVSTLEKRFGGEWRALLRLHPSLSKEAKETNWGDKVLNASFYSDMQELLAACDVLISDYSSVISEFALTGNPIFLYATDVQEYAVERDFYVDYYKLPFSIAEDNEQLSHNILSFEPSEYEKRVRDYLVDVGMKDFGRAAKDVVNRIEHWIEL